jgi:hypothetical protein
MNAERLPLFCDSALAERLERVEARLVATVGEAARGRGTDPAGLMIPVAGGVASFAEECCAATPKTTTSSPRDRPTTPESRTLPHADGGEAPTRAF